MCNDKTGNTGGGRYLLIIKISCQDVELDPQHDTEIDSTENQHHTTRHRDHLQLRPELHFVLGRRSLPEDVGDGVGVEPLPYDLSQCGEESSQGAVCRVLGGREVILLTSRLQDPASLLLLRNKTISSLLNNLFL